MYGGFEKKLGKRKKVQTPTLVKCPKKSLMDTHWYGKFLFEKVNICNNITTTLQELLLSDFY